MVFLLDLSYSDYVRDLFSAVYHHDIANAQPGWVFAMELQELVSNTGSKWLSSATDGYSNDLLQTPMQYCILVRAKFFRKNMRYFLTYRSPSAHRKCQTAEGGEVAPASMKISTTCCLIMGYTWA